MACSEATTPLVASTSNTNEQPQSQPVQDKMSILETGEPPKLPNRSMPVVTKTLMG